MIFCRRVVDKEQRRGPLPWRPWAALHGARGCGDSQLRLNDQGPQVVTIFKKDLKAGTHGKMAYLLFNTVAEFCRAFFVGLRHGLSVGLGCWFGCSLQPLKLIKGNVTNIWPGSCCTVSFMSMCELTFPFIWCRVPTTWVWGTFHFELDSSAWEVKYYSI